MHVVGFVVLGGCLEWIGFIIKVLAPEHQVCLFLALDLIVKKRHLSSNRKEPIVLVSQHLCQSMSDMGVASVEGSQVSFNVLDSGSELAQLALERLALLLKVLSRRVVASVEEVGLRSVAICLNDPSS